MSKLDEVNPRLQCERCGKWRRLITRGEQIMFPYYREDEKGEWVEELYNSLCEPCRYELEANRDNNESKEIRGSNGHAVQRDKSK